MSRIASCARAISSRSFSVKSVITVSPLPNFPSGASLHQSIAHTKACHKTMTCLSCVRAQRANAAGRSARCGWQKEKSPLSRTKPSGRFFRLQSQGAKAPGKGACPACFTQKVARSHAPENPNFFHSQVCPPPSGKLPQKLPCPLWFPLVKSAKAGYNGYYFLLLISRQKVVVLP